MSKELYNDILKDRRQYFIDKVKAPLMSNLIKFVSKSSWIGTLIALISIIRLIRKYPEPTRENTRKPNTHAWIDIWDEFFKYEDNPGRNLLFRAIRKIFICEYEHDSYYSSRIDRMLEWWLEKYQNGEYNKRMPWNPLACWNEPSVIKGRALMGEHIVNMMTTAVQQGSKHGY